MIDPEYIKPWAYLVIFVVVLLIAVEA